MLKIGWFDINAVAVSGDVLPLPATMHVFHWHGETFELPDNAVLLASSVACNNQIFQLGKRVIGFAMPSGNDGRKCPQVWCCIVPMN